MDMLHAGDKFRASYLNTAIRESPVIEIREFIFVAAEIFDGIQVHSSSPRS
jgi:hypothetical protein